MGVDPRHIFLTFFDLGAKPGFGPEIIIPYVLLAIYVAVMLRTRGKQSLHDLVAGTVVIRS